MAFMTSRLSLVAIAFVTSTSLAESGIRDADPLSDWMVGLTIPIPDGNMTGEMPMGMGNFTVMGGHCFGLEVGRLEADDLGSGQILEIGLRVSGFGISCVIDGYSDGELQINISFVDSSFNATLMVHPLIYEDIPDLPLPMGQLNLTSCDAGLAVSTMTGAGVGPLADMLGWLGDSVAGMVGVAINDPICAAMKDFLEVQGTGMLSSYSMLAAILLRPVTPEPAPEALKPVLDWGEYPPVGVLQALLSERFALFSDKLIRIIDMTNFDSQVANEDGVKVVLSRLLIEGFGDQHKPSVAVGAHKSSLNLTADLTGMAIKASLDLAVSLPEQPGFSQKVDVTVGLQRVSVGLRAMIDESALDALELDKAMSSPRCFTQCSAGATNPEQDAIAFEEFQVQVRPLLEVSAPGTVISDGSNLINTIAGALYNGYLPTVNAVVNGGLGLSLAALDELLWKQINDSPACSGKEKFIDLTRTQIYMFWSAFVFIAVLGVPFAILAHIYWKVPPTGSQRRAAGSEQESPTEPAATPDVAPEGGDRDAVTPSAAFKPMCLACEPCVPRAVAVYYPFAVLAVLALFLYADLDIGTTVTMVMAVDGKTTEMGPLFSFSLVNTIAHAWSSGAYFIAVLTVISSAIWPITKLCLLLKAWLSPPHYCSVWRRGKVLDALDAWGKYSFLDSWFLVVTLSAFALEWQSSGSASLKIQTTPQAAFYAYLLATVLSLVLGHIASEYHHRCAEKRATVAAKGTDLESIDAVEESHGNTGVAAAARPEPLHRFAASMTEVAVTNCVLCATVIFAVLGTFLVSFSFEVSGIITEFLFGTSVERSYSLFSVGMSVADQRYGEAGLFALEVVFVSLAVLVPASLFAALGCLWLVPMQLKRQRSLLHVCRLLDAWSCLDVAAFAVAIACFEFAKLAEWLVYEGNFAAPCNMLKNITKEECMKIELHARPALIFLFLAGVLLIVVPKVFLRRFDRAIQRHSENAIKTGKQTVTSSTV